MMLRAEKVTKRFGESQVLKGISLEVNKGDVVAILGPSGSGKTTFLRCLNFLEKADGGSADEVVVFDVHQLPQVLGLRHDLVDIFNGGNTRLGGFLFDLLAVLVGAGEKVGIVPLHFFEPGHGVGGHGGVGRKSSRPG